MRENHQKLIPPEMAQETQPVCRIPSEEPQRGRMFNRYRRTIAHPGQHRGPRKENPYEGPFCMTSSPRSEKIGRLLAWRFSPERKNVHRVGTTILFRVSFTLPGLACFPQGSVPENGQPNRISTSLFLCVRAQVSNLLVT